MIYELLSSLPSRHFHFPKYPHGMAPMLETHHIHFILFDETAAGLSEPDGHLSRHSSSPAAHSESPNTEETFQHLNILQLVSGPPCTSSVKTVATCGNEATILFRPNIATAPTPSSLLEPSMNINLCPAYFSPIKLLKYALMM